MLVTERPKTIDSIIKILERTRFRFNRETELQDGVALALSNNNIIFEKEKVLSVRDRPDFLIDESLAIEIKIQGSFSQAIRQINRYCEHDLIKSVLVLGTPFWLKQFPPTINGKDIYIHRIVGSLF